MAHARGSAGALVLTMVATMVASSGCISPQWGTGDEPWTVVLWSCGDTEYPVRTMIVLYDDGRLVHLSIWGGGEEHGREGDRDLSDDEAMAVAQDVHSTGLLDLDRYRRDDDPDGHPFFRHVEQDQVSWSSYQELRENAEQVGFASLEDRYFGTDEETMHGHACGFRVGVRDEGEWPSTVFSPIGSAGPEALRDYTTKLLSLHLDRIPE